MILVTLLTADNERSTKEDLLHDVMAAMFHDCPEVETGDLAYPFKKTTPKVKKLLDEYDKKWFAEHDIPAFRHSPLLQLCDRLDHLLFAMTYAPDLTVNPRWREMEESIIGAADELGCRDVVLGLIKKARKREWF
jgi:5'-deoxynucleotidase YfbR-like HD superfamily hydrolase